MREWMAYRPHKNQVPIHRSNADVKVVRSARRFGKSVACSNECLISMEESSKSRFLDDSGRDITATLVPGVFAWVVSPNFDVAKQIIRQFKDAVPPWMFVGDREVQDGVEGQRKYQIATKFVDSRNRPLDGTVKHDGLIEFKSAHYPKLLEGVGLDFLYMYEAHDISEEAFEVVTPATNSPGRSGRMIFDGIPPLSPAHWFAREFRAAKADTTGRSEAFTYETYHNPLLDVRQLYRIYVSEKRRRRDSYFDRHYRAIQPEGTGAFFKNLTKAARGDELTEPEPGHRYVAGVDWGRQQDATVFIVKDMDTRHSVFALEFTDHEQYGHMISEIEHAVADWRVERVVSDSTGGQGDVLVEQMLDRNLPIEEYNFSAQNKHRLYEGYALALMQAEVSFPSHWHKLVDQLSSIEVQPSPTTRTFRYRPVGIAHDDWVDAECLAYWGCEPAEVSRGYLLEREARLVAPPVVYDEWSIEPESHSEVRDWLGVEASIARILEASE